jgi:8-oxo-dGTP pyrophosphatase MutT (NUDIX family)/predicted kinase
VSSPRRTESRAQQIARNIRNDVAAGVLRDGEVLPTTRALAEQWDVSTFTIAEAMRVLAAEGLVVSKSRSKRVVHAPGQLARRETHPAKPRVVLVGGYAGSGKTELGRILIRQTGWPMLDKDTLTRPVVEAALELLGQSPHDRESPLYLDYVRPREYEALIAAAAENVECGNSAIVTAPFLREFADPAWITRTRALFATWSGITTLVWVHCDASTMHTYLRHRGAARDASKLADWPGYLAAIDVGFRPPAPHLLVDNSASSAPLQHQARELVRAVLGPDGPGESARASADKPEPQPVVAAVVTSDRGVLVARRNDGRPPWTFIAGEIEPGESPTDAAIREVKEETGLQVVAAAREIGRRVHPQTGRTMIYLACEPVGRTDVHVGDPVELAEVRWVSLGEADDLLSGMYEPVRLHLLRELGRPRA